MKNLKTGGKIFIVILAFQAVVELLLGGSLLLDFPTTLETGFGITYSSELDFLGIALGLYLLLLTALMVLSIIWTLKGNYSGVTLGIVIGVFLTLSGVIVFLQLGRTDGLFIDSSRGLLTIILAYIAGNEIKKKEVN